MTDIAKATCLFFIGLALLMVFGDAFLKEDRRPTASLNEGHPKLKEPPREDMPPERPETPTPSTDVAKACAAYDPIAHPEQVLDILTYASDTTGTPLDVLFAVWMNETGVVYGSGGSDRCPVDEQLKIRCEVGHSCSHQDALEKLAAQFQWNTHGMLCSCGTATMDDNTGNFGGCCGPFQFSAGEIAKDALSRDLDPMTFCGGAVIAGTELKSYHDNPRFGSWEMAIQRYYGLGPNHELYYRHAYEHWQQIRPYLLDADHPERLRDFLTRTAVPRLGWSRKNQQFNTSLLSSN